MNADGIRRRLKKLERGSQGGAPLTYLEFLKRLQDWEERGIPFLWPNVANPLFDSILKSMREGVEDGAPGGKSNDERS